MSQRTVGPTGGAWTCVCICICICFWLGGTRAGRQTGAVAARCRAALGPPALFAEAHALDDHLMRQQDEHRMRSIVGSAPLKVFDLLKAPGPEVEWAVFAFIHLFIRPFSCNPCRPHPARHRAFQVLEDGLFVVRDAAVAEECHAILTELVPPEARGHGARVERLECRPAEVATRIAMSARRLLLFAAFTVFTVLTRLPCGSLAATTAEPLFPQVDFGRSGTHAIAYFANGFHF